MTRIKWLKLILACSAFFAFSAEAALQTWRLTAVSDRIQDGLVPPDFLGVGNTFQIDYVIDLDTPAYPNWDGFFDGAVVSFSLNNETSVAADGVVWGLGNSLIGVNTGVLGTRSDEINYLSLYSFSTNPVSQSVLEALLQLSEMVAGDDFVDLRLDFGPLSVWAIPLSFVAIDGIDVPEPATWTLLLLSGLALASIGRAGAARSHRSCKHEAR